MARFRRIALFCDDHRVAQFQILGLKRGFDQIGIECFAGLSLPSDQTMESFVDIWKPDVVFELDRSRGSLPSLPAHVLHIAWLQSYRAFSQPIFARGCDSDLHYFNTMPDDCGHKIGGRPWKWLHCATNEDIFYPDAKTDILYDLSFCGFMFGGVSSEVLNETIRIDGVPIARVCDVIDQMMGMGLLSYSGFVPSRIHDYLLALVRTAIPDMTLERMPNGLMSFFDEHLFRTISRQAVADGMLAASKNVAFFGDNNWRAWPRFAPFYRGNLMRPHDLANAYRQTRLNVHDSIISLHHRTFEVMGCGRPLLVNHNLFDVGELAITQFFTPGEDFLYYEQGSVEEVAREALADREKLEQIGRNAARRIAEGHLWRHRAEQIVRDVAEL